MASIEMAALRHSYDGADVPAEDRVYALQRIDHVWDDEGAYALLGPSGCGKTTMLNIISGLVRPSQGTISFDGRDVTELEPKARNIAQVFQFPVVYDTMTVANNLAFPLRNRGIDSAEIARRVDAVLKMLRMEDMADRKARNMGAEQKQKISLGRGMVRADVSAILLDEPLTVIDPYMKWQLRSQLKLLHREFGHTMVYVTHDQTEALTFADKVAVMYEGQMVQFGTPEELFERPEHTFVGYFIGSPGMNLFPASIDSNKAVIGSQAVELPAAPADMPATAQLEVGVRPEYMRLGREGMPFSVASVKDTGRNKIVRGTFEGIDAAVLVGADDEVPADARLTFAPQGVNLYADSWRVSLAGQARA